MEKPSAEQSVSQIVQAVYKMIMENAPMGVQLGIVLKEPPDIEIAVNDIILKKEDLYVDFFLCMGYQRSTEGETEMSNVKGDVSIDDFSGNFSYQGRGLDF